MINSIVATGNIGKNPPKLKQTTNKDGKTFSSCWFSFCIKQHGKYANKGIWITCNANGHHAEKLAEWCGKGDTLTIQGKLMQGMGENDEKFHYIWIDEFSPHRNMNQELKGQIQELDGSDDIF